MALEIRFPGVFVEEIPSGTRIIQGVPTSNTAFIGRALQGPTNQVVQVNSAAEFEQTFGGTAPDLELSYVIRQFFLNGGNAALVARVNDPGTDQDFVQTLSGLDSVDSLNLLAIPGVSSQTILKAAADYCTTRRAFFIVDSPKATMTAAQMQEVVHIGLLPQTSNGAAYFPWITVPDPSDGGTPRTTAPSGSVAGVIVRTDRNRGVWKAPAGQEAVLNGVISTVTKLSDSEAEQLNSIGVNPIRSFVGKGTVVWGARTLEGNDQLSSVWKYMPVRRMALFLEESIYRGTQWAIFEPNDEALWIQIRLAVSAFLSGFFRDGAFQGQTAKDAYFVKCDSTTTTQQDVTAGIINILVGFAPLKPAEFIILKIQQKAGQKGS